MLCLARHRVEGLRREVADEQKTNGPVVIKKYANRRLYNTQTSSYVTLDHLCEMVKDGIDFEVRDARTGEDITRSVLTQIIFEEENKGQNLLPIRFLRHLIGMYGNSLQGLVPGYLDMSMESFAKNQEQMRDRMAQAIGGGTQLFENMARQNIAMFERTMKMFSPFAPAGRPSSSEPEPSAGNGAVSEPRQKRGTDELSDLKDQVEAMRKELAELARERK
ncbi:MAG TPA: polyhydroxyalkanoate synthesis repressor PhaR [Rhizomicrobium sp.]|nr:polyhydroxyalkanoate synthesis repressor PhaR [Rhizomicrobium sp.]